MVCWTSIEAVEAHTGRLLQAAPGLRPISLFDELARRHPDRIGPSFRRTLERRVAEWKALHGADRDVMFRQIQQPGRMGLSDFTDVGDLGGSFLLSLPRGRKSRALAPFMWSTTTT